MTLDSLDDWALRSCSPYLVGGHAQMGLGGSNVVIKGIVNSDRSVPAGPAFHSVLEVERGQHDPAVHLNFEAEAEHAASIEGIWTGEIYGPYGWESTGSYVLERGRVLGGNNRHHSAGHYSVLGESYRAEIVVRYHGQPRTIFGEKREQFEIAVIGTLKNGVIEAQIERKDRPQFSVQYRMTKRMELPSGNR